MAATWLIVCSLRGIFGIRAQNNLTKPIFPEQNRVGIFIIVLGEENDLSNLTKFIFFAPVLIVFIKITKIIRIIV